MSNYFSDKQIIIVGGGTSVKEGMNMGLKEKLEGRIVNTLNYAYRLLPTTYMSYVDNDFYTANRNVIEKLPLVIGRYDNVIKWLPNSMGLMSGTEYDPSLEKGVYKASLVGIFALSLAVFIQPKEVYLLGYDFGSRGNDDKGRQMTHFYQGSIEHRGIGKTNYYCSSDRPSRDFGPFKEAMSRINIYNVGLESKIGVFPKISYEQFFNQLDTNNLDQKEVCQELRKTFEGVKSRKV